MAEFSQKRGKRHDDDVLGSAVDFLLANARLVLGVGAAAVLGIATLAVKRVRPCWASSTWDSQRKMAGLGAAYDWHLLLYPATWFALLLGFAMVTQDLDTLICVTLPTAH